MDLKQFVRDIPDFPKQGVLFKDITPLLAVPEAFAYAVDELARKYAGTRVDTIAAAEARGFLLAAPLAIAMKKPLVPLRKPGKLPYRTYSLKYELEYGSAELQMHADGFDRGAKVLLVDDVLATGGTALAAMDLVHQAGGVVVGLAVLIELGFLAGRERLTEITVEALIRV